MSEVEQIGRIRQEHEEQNAPARVLPPPRRFNMVRFDDIKMSTERDYLVKGFLPRTGIAVIWGKPKCGKSFLATDIALHIALGWPYRGRRVVQNPVVYMPLEGAEGYRKRIEAFRQRNRARLVGKAVPFYIIPTSLNLIAEHDKLISDIEDELHATPPACVVFDTLNRSLAGEENSAEDVAAYVRAADAVRAAFNCCIIIVHHCGLDGSRPRGSTALTAAADAQIQVSRTEDGTITAKLEYAKDQEAGTEIGARLEVVEIGTDVDGDPITSCIVVEADAAAPTTPTPKLSAPCSLALTALRAAVEEAGEVGPASNHIPNGIRTVSVELWRRFAYAKDISGGEQNAKRMAFKRAAEQLQTKGLVACWQDRAWPTA